MQLMVKLAPGPPQGASKSIYEGLRWLSLSCRVTCWVNFPNRHDFKYLVLGILIFPNPNHVTQIAPSIGPRHFVRSWCAGWSSCYWLFFLIPVPTVT